MKKTIIQISCLILAILLTAAAFSGCKKTDGTDTSSITESDGVTSVAPPSVVPVTSEGYTVAEGTTIVTIVKDTATDVITMKVATDTALSAFKQVVTANEGYSYKITDVSDVEITDDAAIIADGYKFTLYKDGETEAIVTYTISVVSQEEIASTISEVKKEEERYNSDLAAASSQAAANSSGSNNNPNTTSGTRSGSDVSTIGVSSREHTDSILDGYTLEWRTHLDEDRVGSTETAMLYKGVTSDIDAKYNMKTNIIHDVTANEASSIANAVLAGEKYADLIETQIYTVRALAKRNALCDLFSSSTLDKSNGRFDNGATRSATFQGKAYGVCFGGMNTSSCNGVTFNKELISLYSPDIDIYGLYKKGQWTADKYTQLIQNCSKNLDSNPNDFEIYGVTSNTNIIGIALSSFCGSTAYRDTSTGFIKPGFITTAGIQSLDWCKSLYNNGYWKYIPDIFESINFFASGNSATIVTGMFAVTQASSIADFEIGFVPFPLAGNQTGIVNGAYDATMYAVPVTNKANLDKVCLYINELYALNDPLIDIATKSYQNAGLDDTGCSFIRWALTNTTEEYSCNVFSANISTPIDTSVTNPSKSPASEMNAIASLSQAELDDYYGDLTGQG